MQSIQTLALMAIKQQLAASDSTAYHPGHGATYYDNGDQRTMAGRRFRLTLLTAP